MQNTREAGPIIAAACALVLGLAGMAAGILVQLPTTPPPEPAAQARTAPPQALSPQASIAKPGTLDVAKAKTVAVQAPPRDVKPSTARTVVSYARAPQRQE